MDLSPKPFGVIRVVIPGGVFQFPGIREWTFRCPGIPRRPGMTLNVPYCSNVTITMVKLSAANYLKETGKPQKAVTTVFLTLILIYRTLWKKTF